MTLEVYEGGNATSASDVFSFGVVMWEVSASSGVNPFVELFARLFGAAPLSYSRP